MKTMSYKEIKKI